MIALPFYFLSAVLAAGSPSPSSLSIENCYLGEVYAFNTAQCEFAFANSGSKPIRVFDVKSALAEDSLTPAEVTVAPHAKAYFHATVNTGNAIGNFHRSFQFRTDESGYEQKIANAYGFALTALDQVKPQLDFGAVAMDAPLPEKTIELSSQESAKFTITRILSKPSFVDAEISADGHGLKARIKSDTQWGLHNDFVKLAIDAPRQKEAWVKVIVDAHGDVVPASNPFDMGLMRFTNHNEFKIQLTSRSGKNFKVGKIELENVQAKTQLSPCVGDKSGCQLLTLVISDQQPAGAILGHVWIDFPDYHQRMNLAVWGLIIAKDMQITKIGDEKPVSNDNVKSSDTSKDAAPGSIDLHKAVKDAVDGANAVAPPGTGPLLKWTIANGEGIRGFQIFRGDSEAGPFVLLNPSTIRSTALTHDPVGYQWRDNTAVSGKTYWYYIGIVYNDGHKQQLTGPQKVVAK